MRNLLELQNYQSDNVKITILTSPSSEWGKFHITLPSGDICLAIADNDIFNKGWEHVSVSLDDRCLTWDEMCIIKDIFFYDTEEAMQLHPAKENYINISPYCLHIWRPKELAIPLPPKGLVIGFPDIPDELILKQN